ncbi:DUF1648 domain-containing protein [Mesonia maritima]|uniref:Membrane protein n=1 Tax=Mesonia maritima TaxID=1793873 RepID=A0ABU1K4I8_9FLAO|nr:DUF1648 domain-containing protein [Mesonia maritima]MDR6300517.1 putative membrane protein [Mesonia maritima]
MKIKNRKYKIIGNITLIIVFCLFIIPVIFFSQLPNEIPLHFGFHGSPDNYSSKNNIWLLPILGLLFYVGSLKLEKIFLSELSKKVNHQLIFMVKNLKILILIIVVGFLYLTIQMILVALKISEGLGSWFIYLFLFSVIIFPLSPLINRNKKI